MSHIRNALLLVTSLVLMSGCGANAPTAKAGPYGNNYVKGFPLESNGRPAEGSRESVSNRDFDHQRAIDEMERERREEEQERQEQQQQREQDRVNSNPGEHCLSCP
jgi:TolA-binding protein